MMVAFVFCTCSIGVFLFFFFFNRIQRLWPSQPIHTGLGTPIEYFGKDKVISLGKSFLLLLALKIISFNNINALRFMQPSDKRDNYHWVY